MGLILILAIFTNCNNSSTGVAQKSEANKVTLIAPEAASDQSASLTFQWGANEKVDSFYFQLSGSKDFSSTIISDVIDSTSLDVKGLPVDSTLYWKVRPVIEGAETAWSDVWNFRTITKPEPEPVDPGMLPAPLLLTPKNEATDVALKPTLKWKAVEGAEGYILHVDTSGEGMIIEKQVSATTFTPKNKLAADVTFHWQVRAVNSGDKGKWADIESFTTTTKPKSEPTQLPAPDLLTPKDEAKDVALKPAFKWKAVDGAETYIIHVDVAGDGTLIKEQVSANTFTPNNKLPAETTIYWRVHAVKKGVDGKWSDIITFTTKSTTPAATLVSPTDRAEVSATSVLLKWKALQGISEYRVQVASQNYFSAPVVNKTVAKNSYQTSGLDNEHTYYWRVQAVNDGNTENWSSTYRFTVKVQTTPNGSDRTALMELYHSTGGSNWANNSGWGSDASLGTWYGIETNASGRVTRIDLWHNNLTGNIESVSWGNLNKVKYLNIKYNHLTGQVPASLGSMTSLEVLILQGRNYEIGGTLKEPPENMNHSYHQGKYYSNTNDFHGQIPATIGNLSNLEILELSNAPHIVGPIPPELGKLSNLEGLYLSGDNFSGYTIPDSFGNLTSLKHLMIEGAGLVGELPESFQYLTQLTQLNLGSFDDTETIPVNSLTGPLPDFSNFTNLRLLALSENDFTGPLPHYFNNGNFTHLNTIMLAWNNLTGTLPKFGNLPHLRAFTVDGNNLTGSIDNITTVNAGIKIISLGWNNFSGEFPQSGWPDFYQLKTIRLNTNELTGNIPCSFWKKLDNPELNYAWFNNNKFENVCVAGAKAMIGDGDIKLSIPSN